MNLSLEGKRALVCGGSKGIGKAIAFQLAAQGASTTLLSRDELRLKNVLKDLPTPYKQEHHFIACDMSETSDLLNAINKEHAILPFDILINNSGGPAPGLIHEAETTAFTEAFLRHIVSAQAISKLLFPSMQARNFGRIINITSVSVREPLPRLGVSNTIRAAMGAWAKTWSKEVAPYGITVNTILPGATDTERLQELVTMQSVQMGITYETALAGWLQPIPTGRLGKASEIANLAGFLASESASYITGTLIPVDGGRLNAL